MKILAHINENSDIVTKAYVDQMNKFQILVVDKLPELSDASLTCIYLIAPSGSPDGSNAYDEYICVEKTPGDITTRKWELIGSTEIDLSQYVKKTELNKTLEDYIKKDSISGTGVLVKDSEEGDITTRKITLDDFVKSSSSDTNMVVADSEGKVSTRKILLSDFVSDSSSSISEGDIVGLKAGSDNTLSAKKLTLSDLIGDTEKDKFVKTDSNGNIVYKDLTLEDFKNIYGSGTENAGKVITMDSTGKIVLDDINVNWNEY